MHCPTSLEIQSYIDDELAPQKATGVAGHLGSCAPCRQLARDLAATRDLLQGLIEVPPAPVPAFAAGTVKPPPLVNRLRWVLIPAAACLLLGMAFAWRHFYPAVNDGGFAAAFIEAHRHPPAGADIPRLCDFGLGGDWQ